MKRLSEDKPKSWFKEYEEMEKTLEGKVETHVQEAIEKAKDEAIKEILGSEWNWEKFEEITENENLIHFRDTSKITIASVLRKIAEKTNPRPKEKF